MRGREKQRGRERGEERKSEGERERERVDPRCSGAAHHCLCFDSQSEPHKRLYDTRPRSLTG